MSISERVELDEAQLVSRSSPPEFIQVPGGTYGRKLGHDLQGPKYSSSSARSSLAGNSCLSQSPLVSPPLVMALALVAVEAIHRLSHGKPYYSDCAVALLQSNLAERPTRWQMIVSRQ